MSFEFIRIISLGVFLLFLLKPSLKAQSSSHEFLEIALDKIDKKEYREAKAVFNIALEINPQDASLYLARGRLFLNELNKPKPALDDFNKCLELDPENEEAYYYRGKIFTDFLNEPHKGIQDFETCLLMNEQNELPLYGLGNAYMELGKYNKSKAYYTKAIKLTPDFAEAYFNRAIALYQLEDYNTAIKDINQFIKLKNNHAQVYTLMGDCYQELKELEKACGFWQKAKEMGDKSVKKRLREFCKSNSE